MRSLLLVQNVLRCENSSIGHSHNLITDGVSVLNEYLYLMRILLATYIHTHFSAIKSDAKINYWLRTQLPAHAIGFVKDSQTKQIKLVASYYGIDDEEEFNRKWPFIHEWYERAALPIKKGSMALKNVGAVAFTAFVCSIASSLKHLATIFPDWITLAQDGALTHITQDNSLEKSAHVRVA